jgi:superfamily II DNA/RNA helicase
MNLLIVIQVEHWFLSTLFIGNMLLLFVTLLLIMFVAHSIRRLLPLFQLLKVPMWGLHAQMQQRQRLKNLDRFKANKVSVLVATDVAARGLDIPLVDHVVHYQGKSRTRMMCVYVTYPLV